MLYVFYDPITKLYFTGSHSGVYSYYYTNVFEKAITYLKNIWQQYFVINSEITEFFGNNAELVVKNFHTIEQLVKLSGNTEKNILNTFILKVFPQQLVVSFITSTNKKKKKAYKLNPFYVQHNLVNV